MTVSAHYISAYVGETKLDVIDASIGMDESWSPHIQGNLTIATPDLSVLNVIDPRQKVKMRVFLEQVFGDSLTVAYLSGVYGGGTIAAMTTAYTAKFIFELTALWFQPWNNFGVRAANRRDFYVGIRSRSIDHNAGTVDITVASDEALLQDYALTSLLTYAPGTLSVRSAVVDALKTIGAYLQTGTADGTIDARASEWLPGQSAWDYISPLVQQAKLRFYCDEKGRFWLLNDTYVAPGQTQLTYTGTIKTATDDVDRDAGEWFDAVVIKYSYVDALGAQVISYDIAAQPNFSKVKLIEYDTYYPGAGAAQRVLNRTVAKGRQQAVSAVSDYTVTPSQSVTLQLPNTAVQTGYVSAVSWNYPADDMQVTTRGLIETPTNSWDYVATGISWNSIATGISWNTYTP